MDSIMEDEYIAEVFGHYPEKQWPRVAHAFLKYGINLLAKSHDFDALPISDLEHLAESAARGKRPKHHPTMSVFMRELSSIKQELSKLDRKIERKSLHVDKENACPNAIRDLRPQTTTHGHCHKLQEHDRSASQPKADPSAVLSQTTVTEWNFADESGLHEKRPPRNRGSHSPVNRLSLNPTIYPCWWGHPESHRHREREPVRESEPERRHRPSEKDMREAEYRRRALEKSALANARLNCQIAGLNPISMVFEKREFTAPYKYREPNPIVVEKQRRCSCLPDGSQEPEQFLEPKRARLKVRPRSGTRTAFGRKSTPDKTLPRYLHNVESKIKDTIAHYKRLHKIKTRPENLRQSDYAAGRDYAFAGPKPRERVQECQPLDSGHRQPWEPEELPNERDEAERQRPLEIEWQQERERKRNEVYTASRERSLPQDPRFNDLRKYKRDRIGQQELPLEAGKQYDRSLNTELQMFDKPDRPIYPDREPAYERTPESGLEPESEPGRDRVSQWKRVAGNDHDAHKERAPGGNEQHREDARTQKRSELPTELSSGLNGSSSSFEERYSQPQLPTLGRQEPSTQQPAVRGTLNAMTYPFSQTPGAVGLQPSRTEAGAPSGPEASARFRYSPSKDEHGTHTVSGGNAIESLNQRLSSHDEHARPRPGPSIESTDPKGDNRQPSIAPSHSNPLKRPEIVASDPHAQGRADMPSLRAGRYTMSRAHRESSWRKGSAEESSSYSEASSKLNTGSAPTSSVTESKEPHDYECTFSSSLLIVSSDRKLSGHNVEKEQNQPGQSMVSQTEYKSAPGQETGTFKDGSMGSLVSQDCNPNEFNPPQRVEAAISLAHREEPLALDLHRKDCTLNAPRIKISKP